MRDLCMSNVIASFDVSSTEGKIKVFNAQNGSSVSMKNLEDGTVIKVTGVLQYTDKFDTYGREQEGTITVLFSEDGNSYAAVSETVAKAGEKLMDFLSDTGLESVNVKLVKQLSNQGKEFLNLQLVG